MSIDIYAGIAVRPPDREKWLEALARAEEEHITLVRTGSAGDNFPSESHRYKVRSGENTYIVVVTRFSSPIDGMEVTTVTCTCRAGQSERICKHASLAVKVANCFPISVQPQPTEQISRMANAMLAERWRK